MCNIFSSDSDRCTAAELAFRVSGWFGPSQKPALVVQALCMAFRFLSRDAADW